MLQIEDTEGPCMDYPSDYFNNNNSTLWNGTYWLISYFLGFAAHLLTRLFMGYLQKKMAMRQKSIMTVQKDSVTNPTAQTAILCELPGNVQAIINQALKLSSPKSSWPVPLKVLLRLQLEHGLRVSEVLRIDLSDLLSLNRIRIKASKNSIDRIISFTDEFGYLKMCRGSGIKPFSDYDRFFIYRLYKKNSLQLFTGKGLKYAVTHCLRHAMALTLSNEVDNEQLIQDAMRHKSANSTKWYTLK